MPSRSFWISTFTTIFQENWDGLEIRILIFRVHAKLPIFSGPFTDSAVEDRAPILYTHPLLHQQKFKKYG
jgi:hypothetical protein